MQVIMFLSPSHGEILVYFSAYLLCRPAPSFFSSFSPVFLPIYAKAEPWGRRCIVPACAFLISCDLGPGDLAAISMQKPVPVPLELTSEQLCIPRVPLDHYVDAYLHSYLHSHKGGLVTSPHSLLWNY